MTLIGLDLNSTRVRAIQGENPGSGPHVPFALPLADGERELPLALSLEERPPRVGRAGVGLCRRSPHLACLDFLPYLGDDRSWDSGRQRLDAAAALARVLENLQRRFGRADGVTVAAPAYFHAGQAALLAELAGRARWRLLGSVPSPLAVALSAHLYLPWSGQAIIVDVDGYALTLSAVAVDGNRLHLLHVQASPQLGRGAWLGRLLDGAAVRCIRLNRRDPRESAETEQALFDQMAEVLDSRSDEEPAEIVLQTPHWYQHLRFSSDELSALCAPLVQRALAQMQPFLAESAPFLSSPRTEGDREGVGAVLLTGPAARLPGLAAAIEELIHPPDVGKPAEEENADFGEDLIEANMLSPRLHVLDDDAAARSAFEIALRQHRGELPRGHLDSVALPGMLRGEAREAKGEGRNGFCPSPLAPRP